MLLLTCSARIPVYVVLIALIVPDEMIGVSMPGSGSDEFVSAGCADGFHCRICFSPCIKK